MPNKLLPFPLDAGAGTRLGWAVLQMIEKPVTIKALVEALTARKSTEPRYASYAI